MKEKTEYAAVIPAWRQMLEEIFADKTEGRRLIETTNISPLTVARWISGETVPRKANLLRLVERCQPEIGRHLFRLLVEEHILDETDFPSFVETANLDAIIPPEFYRQIVASTGSTPASLRMWSICRSLLLQCSTQLAPQSGITISIFTCTPPLPGQQVRSLRELASIDAQHKILLNTRFLLGAESLIGQVCSSFQCEIEQPIVLQSTADFKRLFNANSAVAAPLMRSGQFGGSLLFLSPQTDFFTEARMHLIQDYADLAALAFEDSVFYPRERIRLALLPPPARQTTISSSAIRQRIIAFMQRQHISSEQNAEIEALHSIEEDQIQIALQQ